MELFSIRIQRTFQLVSTQVCQILFYPVVHSYLRHYKEMDVQCRKHEKGTGDTDTFCLCSYGWFCKHSVTSSYLPRGKC